MCTTVENFRIRVKVDTNEFEAEGLESTVLKHLEIWQNRLNHPSSGGHEEPTESFFFDEKRGGMTLRNAKPFDTSTKNIANALLRLLYAYTEINRPEVFAPTLAQDLRHSGFVDLKRLSRAFDKLQKSGHSLKVGRGKGTKYRLTNPGLDSARKLTDHN